MSESVRVEVSVNVCENESVNVSVTVSIMSVKESARARCWHTRKAGREAG